jgi:D-beta-D-heptose 7-phosphate kinase / D-beta-D-heptose 1-phosphate adenosyltransferase
VSQLASLLPELRGRRVAVIGEAILDSWLQGRADRISREAPVPIVTLDARVDAPGGAANTAVNVARLGGRVSLVSVLGSDGEAERLRRGLATAGVAEYGLVARLSRRTLAKQRIVAGGQMLLRFDTGTTDPVDAETEDELIERVRLVAAEVDALIVSDYGYGILTDRVISAIGELQRRRPRVLVVDARDLRRYRNLGVTAVKPNYDEAIRLLGERELADRTARPAQVGSRGQELLELTTSRIVALTVDTEGAFIFERDQPPYRTYARPRNQSQAAGAGDSFVATLTLALAANLPTTVAAELASAAAAVVVGKDGTASCGIDELGEALSTSSGKQLEADRLAARLAYHREQGHRIVFTNGVFDIIHRGHITYLNRAKALGDVLIVAVNSDESVRRLKGPERPINGLDDRLEVLEALSCVDHVVAFEADTPADLIQLVRPDVYVKGGDYSPDRLPEAPLVESLGGTVKILPFIEDRSTSGVIARVRGSAGQNGGAAVPTAPG